MAQGQPEITEWKNNPRLKKRALIHINKCSLNDTKIRTIQYSFKFEVKILDGITLLV